MSIHQWSKRSRVGIVSAALFVAVVLVAPVHPALAAESPGVEQWRERAAEQPSPASLRTVVRSETSVVSPARRARGASAGESPKDKWEELAREKPADPSIRTYVPPRRVSSTTPSRVLQPTIVGNTIIFTGDANANTLVITMTGPRAGNFDLDGLTGSFSDFDFIVFNGDAGADVLEVIGTGTTPGTYTPSETTTGNGTITIESVEITFTGLAPVTVSSFASLTVNLGAGDDVITVDSPAAGQNRVSGTAGGVPIESLTFFDIPTVQVNLLGGTDTLEILSPGLIASSLTSFTVDAGDGTDALTLNSQSGVFDPHVIEPSSQGAGTIVDFVAATTNVTYAGVEQINLQGQLADGDPFGVDGTTGNDSIIYSTGATSDQGTVTGTFDQAGTPFTLSVAFSGMAQPSVMILNNFSQVGGTDAFTFNGVASADTVIINASSLTDTVSAALYANLLHPNFSQITINGNDGDDVVSVDPGTASFTVNGGNPAGPATPGDTLAVVADSGNNVLVTTMSSSGSGSSVLDATPSVTFTGIETQNFDGLSGSDALEVIGTGSTGGTYDPSATTPGNGTIVVDGMTINFTGLAPVTMSSMASMTFTSPNSDDVISVDSPAAGENRISGTSGGVAFEAVTFFDIPTVIVDLETNDGLSPDDSFTILSPGLIASNLTSFTVDAGAGNDTLTLNSQDGTFDPHVIEPASQGAGTIVDFFAATTDVNYTGIDQISLVGQIADGDPFGVDGTTGDDSIVYTPGATSDQGTVTATFDQLGTPFTISVSFSGMEQAAGLGFNAFSQIGGTDDFTFEGVTGVDVLDVASFGLSDSVSSSLFAGLFFGPFDLITVNGNDGDDVFNVEPGPSEFVIDGGNPVLPTVPGDTLYVNLDFIGWAHTETGPDSGFFTFDTASQITYASIESLPQLAPGIPALDPRLLAVLALLLAAAGWRVLR